MKKLRFPSLPVMAGMLALLTAPVPAGEAVKATLINTSEAVFGRPHDLALTPPGLYLAVADVDNNAIKILDPGKLRVVAEVGAGELSAPHDVTFQGEDRMLVADSGNDRIVVYKFSSVYRDGSTNAERLAIWSDGLDSPEGVVAGRKGRIYVANTGDDTVVALEDGKIVATAGSAGGKEFERPHDVDVDANDRVIATDPGNNRLIVFDRDLKVLQEVGGDAYGFNEPKYITTAEDGMLVVADEYNNRIVLLDIDFNPVGMIGTGKRGDGPGEVYRPEGAEVAGKYLWIADTHNHRIQLYKRW